MTLLAVLALSLAMAATGLVAYIDWQSRRKRVWRTVRLRFGRDLTEDAVIAFLDRVAGLSAGRWITLDVEADRDGIQHYLRCDEATLDVLRGSLRAIAPSLRLVAADDRPPASYRFGRVIRLGGRYRVLRSDNVAETSAAILGAMQPVEKSERVLLRWLITTASAVRVPTRDGDNAVDAEALRLMRAKNAVGVVRAFGLVAVETGERRRSWHLQARLLAVLRTRLTPYGHLRTVVLEGRALKWPLAWRAALFADRYGASELAGLLGWPAESPSLPGLTIGTSPLLIPTSRIPAKGRVLGVSTWPGMERSIAQPVIGALSHTLITGPTGVGKSTLVTSLAANDIASGRGVVLIDGKGDTAEAVLARLPEYRRDDVIVLDCASSGPLPGLRAFGRGQPELAADVLLGVLSDLFRDSWGPLSERWLRAGLVAVAHDDEGTLADVPFVFSDAPYRRRLAGRLRDPVSRAAFATFEAMSSGERAQQLAAPLNKLGTLLGRPVVRTVLGQVQPKLDFTEVLRSGKIVVVSLAPARVGAPAARLIGALTVFGLFQAVQGRAGMPMAARRPFFVYVDEPKALGDLPMPLDALLEQARGLGVGMVLAPQSIGQLPKAVREAALTNVATRIVFRQHGDDARQLARDLPGVTPEELGELAAFEALARIGLGPGDVAPLVSIKTLPVGRPVSRPRELGEASVARYGMSLAEVDDALDARHHNQHEGPVGRRRRTA